MELKKISKSILNKIIKWTSSLYVRGVNEKQID